MSVQIYLATILSLYLHKTACAASISIKQRLDGRFSSCWYLCSPLFPCDAPTLTGVDIATLTTLGFPGFRSVADAGPSLTVLNAPAVVPYFTSFCHVGARRFTLSVIFGTSQTSITVFHTIDGSDCSFSMLTLLKKSRTMFVSLLWMFHGSKAC